MLDRVGSPQKHSTLVRAGVYNASAIVVLDQGSEGVGFSLFQEVFHCVHIVT